MAASDGGPQDTQTINVQVARGLFESGNTNVADTFVFKPGFGLAVVKNFDATSSSHDVIELDHALFRGTDPHASPVATLDLIQHHSYQLGPDVIIVTDTRELSTGKAVDVEVEEGHIHMVARDGNETRVVQSVHHGINLPWCRRVGYVEDGEGIAEEVRHIRAVTGDGDENRVVRTGRYGADFHGRAGVGSATDAGMTASTITSGTIQ